MPSAEARRKRLRELIPAWTLPYAGEDTDGAIALVKTPQSSMPSIGLRRHGRSIGTFLTDHNVVLLGREEDRPAATAALAAAGFAPRLPLRRPEQNEPLLRMKVTGVGAWGNVIAFHGVFPEPRPSALLALYFIDEASLHDVSPALRPGIGRLLELMGLPLSVTEKGLPAKLKDKLDWDERTWGWDRALDGPYIRTPGVGQARLKKRTLTTEAAATVPQEVATAVDELLHIPVDDPFNRRDSTHWENQHGVLDAQSLAKLLSWKMGGAVDLPDGWEEHWEAALHASASHAPSLTALRLHDAFPDWWASLPLDGVANATKGVWLLGHSDTHPSWMRASETTIEDDRMSAAVAVLVHHLGDLRWLQESARAKVDCWVCGTPFEPGMLAAGRIAQLGTAKVCHLCMRLRSGAPPVTSSPTLEAGAISAVAEAVRLAGRVIAVSMVDELANEGKTTPESLIVLRHALPDATERGWGKWLASAGVLGDGWRPSRGYISVAADGHLCRSLFERIIDDYFYAHGIAHEPEPFYPFDADLNPSGSRADWQLADGRFVEAAGLMTESAYATKMARKEELAQRHGIALLVLTEKDLPRLSELIPR